MLGIHVHQEDQHGYMQTIITVNSGSRVTLKSIIEECKDNKAGYGGGQVTADKISALAKKHIAQGYIEQYEVAMFSEQKISFDVRYQHYENHYCQPHLTFNEKPQCVLHSAAFVTSIVGKNFPRDPNELVAKVKRQRRHEVVFLEWLDWKLLIKPVTVEV